MDLKRAEEIINSEKTYEVIYNKIPIWIESLDPNRQTALISSGTFPEGPITVPVTELSET